jgi:CP family cyanate transporter-like MFS transporter
MRWLLLAGVWALYASFGLVATCLAPLVPLIESELKISHAAMGSVMGAWQFVYIVAAIPCGILLDRLGSRAALFLGVALVGLSALARSVADDYVGLLVSVMIFGLGGPLISAGAPKVVTEHFEGSARGLAMGIYTTGPAIGGAVSLTLTHSVLLPWLGDWRELMRLWAGVSLGAGVLWLVVSRRPTLRTADAAPEGESSEPQLSVTRHLFSLPAVRTVIGMSVGIFLMSHGLASWLPELLRSRGMTAVAAGYASAIPTGVGVIAVLLIPRLAVPERRLAILLVLTAAAGLATVCLQFEARVPLFAGLILQGTAATALTTILVLTLIELPGVGERRAGTASGLFFSAAQIGGVLGPLGLGALYELTGGFAYGLGLLTATAVAVGMAAVRLRSHA